MLTRVDRVQLSTNEPDKVVESWTRLLDAKEVARDNIAVLSANRITLDVGDCQIEILSPDGDGIVKSHLDSHPGGPFSAGFSTQDPDRVKARLNTEQIEFAEEHDQIFIEPAALGIPGLRLVISADETRDRQGVLQNLYEITHLTSEVQAAADEFARIFELNFDHFVPIKSEDYGYDGYLTLVNPDELDRIETINPFDLDKTMGRFFKKFGASFYMCYGECDDLPSLRSRLAELVPNDWTGDREGPIDGLFIHPNALGGVMLGVSRTTHAWSWSGSPDRIEPNKDR